MKKIRLECMRFFIGKTSDEIMIRKLNVSYCQTKKYLIHEFLILTTQGKVDEGDTNSLGAAVSTGKTVSLPF